MVIGVIGLGKRAEILITKVNEAEKGIKVKALCDIHLEKAKEKLNKIKNVSHEKINYYKDYNEMLEKEKLDGVIIGTSCDVHTEIAIKLIQRKIPIFLEKPVSINCSQLKMLMDANAQYNPKVVVSFPLRVSQLAVEVKEIIASDKIGDIAQVQAYNDVPYGRVYYHDWYRNENLTGGLWLQKATHDFDYINYILDDIPLEICAMESKQIFKGDLEDKKCSNCQDRLICKEGPYYIEKIYKDDLIGENCCFSKNVGNHDSGSAIIKYGSGIHVAYSQNFFARKKAARRGARFYGYKGTLEFDWYKDEIKVYSHLADKVETYKFDQKTGSHFGGDDQLINNFISVMSGGESFSDLNSGILSAKMSLGAKMSAEQGKFIKIKNI